MEFIYVISRYSDEGFEIGKTSDEKFVESLAYKSNDPQNYTEVFCFTRCHNVDLILATVFSKLHDYKKPNGNIVLQHYLIIDAIYKTIVDFTFY